VAVGGPSVAASVAAVSMRGCQPPRDANEARAGASMALCGKSTTASRGAAPTDASQAETMSATRGQNAPSTGMYSSRWRAMAVIEKWGNLAGSGHWGLVSESLCLSPPPPQAPQGTLMSSDLIKHVTDASFEADVLKSGKPVLVDYWAEWCGPCKAIAPILDELSTHYGEKLQIAKMNVDENQEVPGKFGIRGIPTLMLFKDGQLAGTLVGAHPKAKFTAFLDSHL
jgi:thioredoxin 1